MLIISMHGRPEIAFRTSFILPDGFEVKPALCVDLDETIRFSRNGGFIKGPDDIVLFPDAEPKLWEYRKNGYLIIAVSNQGGVAHGYKTLGQNDAEIERTVQLFDKNPFHSIWSCVHMEGGTVEPYCHRSLCRKPDIGMLVMAEVNAFENGVVIDWNKSLMVGDRDEDLKLAQNAGMGFKWANEFFGRPTHPTPTPA